MDTEAVRAVDEDAEFVRKTDNDTDSDETIDELEDDEVAASVEKEPTT